VFAFCARRRVRDPVHERPGRAPEAHWPAPDARGIQLADRVYVYDNSVDDAEALLCARTQEGALRKVYVDLPQWVTDAVATLPRHA